MTHNGRAGEIIIFPAYNKGQNREIDGGQILLKEMLRDKYRCMADCIPDVLDMAYGYPVEFSILV